MSRSLREARKHALMTWPVLAEFLHEAVHGDNDVPVGQDVDRVIASYDLDRRKSLALEWWHWNATAGRVNDIRVAVEALDPNVLIDTAEHARRFMNGVYDKVVVTMRSDAGQDWKP